MGMKMNKDKIINKLVENINRSTLECNIIYDILDKNGIVGRKSKEKIKRDFIEKLNVSESEADKIYNTCMEIVVNDFFSKNN